jgi:pseudouridine-5'-phosphate glycosidase
VATTPRACTANCGPALCCLLQRITPPKAADFAHSWLNCSAPVAAAETAGRPLVALESTIVARGMPDPENIRTAREVEALIRDVGAEPATIALIGGRIHIGVSDDELELPGRSDHAQKVSRRDLAAVLAETESL